MPPAWMARDLTAERFGRLVVLRRAARQGRRIMWRCRCDCGQEPVVRGGHLTTGAIASCGCLVAATLAKIRTRHGATIGGRTREFSAWIEMRKRCLNPKVKAYHWYGGRGVTIYAPWRDDFPTFLRDVGICPTGLTLDRIDPYGNYEPGNVRWATWDEQRHNKRRHHSQPA